MAARLTQRALASAAVLVLAFAAAPAARAALFEDDEARKAILDLRQRVEAQRRAQESSMAEALATLRSDGVMRQRMGEVSLEIAQQQGVQTAADLLCDAVCSVSENRTAAGR